MRPYASMDGSSRPMKPSGSRCRCCCNYAGSDERVNAGIPEFRAALDAVGVPYSLNMYPGTQHGFHNDSSAARYNEPAAKLAWSRTIDFFDTYLKTIALKQSAGCEQGVSHESAWPVCWPASRCAASAVAEEDIWSKMINKETNGAWYVQPEKPKAKYIKAEVPGEPGVPRQGEQGRKSLGRAGEFADRRRDQRRRRDHAQLYYARAEEPAEGGSSLTAAHPAHRCAIHLGARHRRRRSPSEWKSYCAYRVASASMPTRTRATCPIHLATAKQVIDLGPVFVFNFGKGYDTKKLDGCDG